MPDLPCHVVIGLEIHVQLLTRTKLFCGCSTQFGLPPNSATCPVCIGMPGVLPVMNRRAFELALKAALALNCRIASFTKWDRKNYYYPDLPKNYQISQYDLPFSKDGWLEITAPAPLAGAPVATVRGGGDPSAPSPLVLPQGERGARRIGIIRVHLEEDAGKLLHDESGRGGDSRVDLNRTGTPLLEIVSQPDLASPAEAKAYLEEMRLLLRELEISDCEMQEGSLRCDANINLHILASTMASRGRQPPEFPLYMATPIVELKNLNSFRGVERALKYEAERQYSEFQARFGKEWQPAEAPKEFRVSSRAASSGEAVRLVDRLVGPNGKPVSKATAGWDDDRGVTSIQRRKEEAEDYRYFPEPDLVPVVIDQALLDGIRAELGELPAAQRVRLAQQYGLSAYDAEVLSRQGRAFVAYFEQVVGRCGDPAEAKNWLANDVMQTLNDRKLLIRSFPISAPALGDLIAQTKSTGLNKQRAREVFAEMLASGTSANQAIAKLGFQVVGDEAQLLEIVRKALADNPKAVADFKKGKQKAADAIKGAVMRQTKGMANTELVQKLLMQELEKG
jgi:aspartyl-tRNA(Asn)/glutamyl-tRNA(Gln) amidotransferase subunit B